MLFSQMSDEVVKNIKQYLDITQQQAKFAQHQADFDQKHIQ